MKIRKAERKRSKIKIGIQGPSGSGKTLSALYLAKGLTGNFNNVCIIDTESSSADLYAHLGNYSVLPMEKPFSPERYIQAIEAAYNAGYKCLIIDSISHCWEFLLEYHGKLTGNSFANWSKITPRYNDLIQRILSTPIDIIVTLRTKQDYVLTDKGNGKLVPEKVGLKSIARDGIDYEFTLLFELDIHHYATCSKDRTGLFQIEKQFIIDPAIGEKIAQWCNTGTSVEKVKAAIVKCTTLQQLTEVYKEYKSYYNELESDFLQKKSQLTNNILTHPKVLNNGIRNHKQQ